VPVAIGHDSPEVGVIPIQSRCGRSLRLPTARPHIARMPSVVGARVEYVRIIARDRQRWVIAI